MNKLAGVLGFVLGAGVGSGVTYYILRERFEAEQLERENQIKAAYDARYEDKEVNEEKDTEPIAKPEINPALKREMIEKKKQEYRDYSNIVKSEDYSKETESMALIENEVIIEPDNIDGLIGFGEQPYDTVFATIYADGYLVDDRDNIIDIDEQIGGKETLEHFGEGDDPELLHVRNILYEIDYEIDRDERTYAEVSGKDPEDLPDLD